MKELRFWVGNLIYFFAAILIILLGFRLIIELLGLSNSLSFLITITDLFFSPFANTFGKLPIAKGFLDFNILYSIIAIVFIALLIEQIILGFLQNSIKNFIIEFFISVFKFLEYIIMARILFKLFAANNTGLVSFVYSLTGGENGVLSTGIINFNNTYKFELITLIILIIIIVLDIFIEKILEGFLGSIERKKDRGIRHRFKRIRTVEYYE